eukprot:17877-Heterococcus_DN1.PRE.1
MTCALHAPQPLQNRPIAVSKLGCLDREATKQFVTGYLQCDSEAFPSKVFDFIWEASQGNPMVCEEMVQTLLGSGVLAEVNNGNTTDISDVRGQTFTSSFNFKPNNDAAQAGNAAKNHKVILEVTDSDKFEAVMLQFLTSKSNMETQAITKMFLQGFDELTAQEQYILKIAGVLGSHFTQELIECMLPQAMKAYDITTAQ